MDNNFLLTYAIDGDVSYDWFQDEEELEIFVEEMRIKHIDKFKIFEAIEIIECRNIELNKE